jgi:hypothetical protein
MITGVLSVIVVVTETEVSSTLVAVIVYVPATVGGVQTFPLKVPALALHVIPSVAPPLAVELNDI